jgi:hypothetical protein
MKATATMTVQSQKETSLLASRGHSGYRPMYDGGGDLWEVMLRLKVDGEEGAGEEPGLATSWVMIVMCWLQLSRICEG